jgi:chromosome condensin MukBEF complex kleisin-like MukF subunit
MAPVGDSMNINYAKLDKELRDAGIIFDGVDSTGRVLDKEGKEIQDRKDIADIVAKHDPIEIPQVSIEDKLEDIQVQLDLLQTTSKNLTLELVTSKVLTPSQIEILNTPEK